MSTFPIDISTPSLSIDWNKCIKCYSCVRACDGQGPSCYIKPEQREIPNLNIDGKPALIETKEEDGCVKLSHYLSETRCIGCGLCSTVCPVGAITVKNEVDIVDGELKVTAESKGKRASVALIAPSARVGLAECFGHEQGTFSEQGLVALLRSAGFTHVFDVQTGADLTTAVDAEELIEACERHVKDSNDIEDSGFLPIFTSCCPAWVALAETDPRYQKLLPRVSTARSCVSMAGALVRQCTKDALGTEFEDNEIHIVEIMPCSAKKLERARKVLKNEINQCLTIVETAELIARRLTEKGIAREDITFENGMVSPKLAEAICNESGVCDLFLSDTSGGAYAFGRAGGVAETVARYALRKANLIDEKGFEVESKNPLNIVWETVWESKDKLQYIREFTHPLITIGSLSSTDNAEPAVICHATGGQAVNEALRMINEGNERKWAIVEQMMCPGGCVSGAGMQWLKTTRAPVKRRGVIEKRTAALDQADGRASYKAANDNPTLKRLFSTLDHEKQHACLHTHFTAAKNSKENSL